ncbi:TraI/MobA(P) family conjugative relaxase [Rhodospirillum sp. A1_3_36]|uniref:TraI/MobA(P) family conjugative relaxase n=1 Tax=Rhodospirillum sp. A1_3_36 TaxID=3391666 RepID=UPI0039A5741F
MIATKLAKKKDLPDNYTRLGEYIAAAKETGEKLDKLWIVNCDAGETLEDLPTALAEVEAVRKMRPDINNKSYHLSLSFRSGDRDRLTEQDLKDIEAAFAKALGFEDHQRVAGTHINTDNFHMHVAYTMLHPETLKIHHPHQDYKALEKTARAMEIKYGLQVDRGMSDTRDRAKGSTKARDYEAHTWEQSFQNHVLERREDLLTVFGEAENWPRLHEYLAAHGITLKRRGNGLVLAEADGKQTMKASLLARETSLGALEKRLGTFEPPRDPDSEKEKPPPQRPKKRTYRPRPILRHPATSRLWGKYLDQKRAIPKRPSLAARAARNWKQFLMMEAYGDPLALVLVMAHKEMIDTLLGNTGPKSAARKSTREPWKPPPVPAGLREALEHWKASSTWAKPGDTPWLGVKGPVGRGCRLDDGGNLLVPFRDSENRLRGVRVLSPTGVSLDMGDSTPGMRHVIDPDNRLEHGGSVILATDYAMATAIRAATERPVIVVPNEAALSALVDEFRRTRPDLEPVIARATEPRLDPPRTVSRTEALAMGAFEEEALSMADVNDADLPPRQHLPREMDWSEAAAMGAFEDDALSLEDVLTDQEPPKPGIDRGPFGAPVISLPADTKPMEIRSAFADALKDRALLTWREIKAWATPGNSPWLKASNIRGYGIKITEAEEVAIPLKDAQGRLRDVLLIDKEGNQKPVLGDPDGPPLRHLLDPERRLGKDPLVVATDYASAAAIHRATRLPVILAGDADRWAEVAEELRDRYPDECLVIALDADTGPQAEALARRLRASVVRPDLPPEQTPFPPRALRGRVVDPTEAAAMGAFEDHALGIEDARSSLEGLNPVTGTPIRTFGDMAAAGLSERIRETLAPEVDDRALIAWSGAKPVEKNDTHPWLEGLARTARRDLRRTEGNLIVPLRDRGKHLWAVQVVRTTGEITLLGQSDRPGIHHVVGDRAGLRKGPLIITADPVSARVLHQVSGRPVILATADETLKSVAEAFRGRDKDRKIVIVATDRHMARRNESLILAEAAAKAVGGTLLRPPLDDDARAKGFTSFGDLAAVGKHKETGKALRAANLTIPRPRGLTPE